MRPLTLCASLAICVLAWSGAAQAAEKSAPKLELQVSVGAGVTTPETSGQEGLLAGIAADPEAEASPEVLDGFMHAIVRDDDSHNEFVFKWV